MCCRSLLNPILGDDRLTRGLDDPEARMLVEWLVECTENLAGQDIAPDYLHQRVQQLCRRARSIGLFVRLWCHHASHGAACQLAATERFAWPLPPADADPCALMATILAWESSVVRSQWPGIRD